MDFTNDEPHFVRCLKCLKILKCSRYDTTTLLEHIRTDHPEIEIVDSVSQSRNSGSPLIGVKTTGGAGGPPCGGATDGMGKDRLADGCLAACKNTQLSIQPERACAGELPQLQPYKQIEDAPAIKDCGCEEEGNEAKTIYSRHCKTRKPSSRTQTSRKCALYRTSIERWRPAHGTLYCPKCGANKRPMIKTRSERLSQNPCSAACVLACWPFCFLPFLNSGEDKEYLHCAQCQSFLGLYDRHHNCIKPNRDFLVSPDAIRQENAPAEDCGGS